MSNYLDPDYVVQGIYAGQAGIIAETDGSDDENEAREMAQRMLRSPWFEGDRVRIITRDGDLVWESPVKS